MQAGSNRLSCVFGGSSVRESLLPCPMSAPVALFLVILSNVAAVTVFSACDGKFGSFIEGAAVTPQGQHLAVDWQNQRNAIGFATDSSCGLRAKVEDLGGSQINGVRALPNGDLLATDMGNHRVVLIQGQKARTYCQAAGMIQPNDLTISSRGVVYLSGQRWTDSTAPGDGEVWLCRKGVATKLDGGLLGRTNGIELSLDEQRLLVSEAYNKGGRPASNRIWSYAINPDSGSLGQRQLFYDFSKDGTGHVDIDGMRLDTAGNLYVARNEGKEVAVLSPYGQLLRKIPLPFSAPTNLEFGGPDGKTLMVVGRCGVGTPYGAGTGCIYTVQVAAPGRYWSMLQKKLPPPGAL